MTNWQQEHRPPTVGEAADFFDAHAEDGGDPEDYGAVRAGLDATQDPTRSLPGAGYGGVKSSPSPKPPDDQMEEKGADHGKRPMPPVSHGSVFVTALVTNAPRDPPDLHPSDPVGGYRNPKGVKMSVGQLPAAPISMAESSQLDRKYPAGPYSAASL